RIDVDDVGAALKQLKQGQHLYLRVSQTFCESAAHSMALSATRLSGSRVQITLLNSNGWSESVCREAGARFPAIGKIVDLKHACASLSELSSGTRVPAASMTEAERLVWHDEGFGAPLAAWLRSVGRMSELHTTGPQMTPQKGDDCSIEVEFAWLASVLPEADYKLTKAHVLNVLLHAALATGVGEEIVQRLRERVTSSLSAFAMAIRR
ncbi:MAG TPA: hypothetical protein VFP68_01350, partial [Burkholderiaceae bacterium]|nr:hypothetical protein [Burkholderiaceae bacterium]